MALLTVDDIRKFTSSPLEDDAIQLLLDAAEMAITARFGPVADPYPDETVVEHHDGNGYELLTLRRQAASIVAVSELVDTTTFDLENDDYRLRDDGRTVQRLPLGTTPPILPASRAGRAGWSGFVTIEFAPVNDLAERKRVQAALVALDMNYAPGLTAESVGEWSVRANSSGATTSGDANAYRDERASIIESMAILTGLNFA
jgi:hypothetical protein